MQNTKYAVTVFLISYLQTAASIKCYECNSANNSMCLDPTIYDQESLQRYLKPVNCRDTHIPNGNQDFFCRKMIQTILRKAREPEVRVTRSCGWVRHKRECYKADNEDHLETVCQCFTDGCNAADTLSTTGPLLLVLSFIGFKSRKLLSSE